MKWQYLVLDVRGGMLESDEPLQRRSAGATVGVDQLNLALNELGAEGWEALSTTFDSKGSPQKILLKRGA